MVIVLVRHPLRYNRVIERKGEGILFNIEAFIEVYCSIQYLYLKYLLERFGNKRKAIKKNIYILRELLAYYITKG